MEKMVDEKLLTTEIPEEIITKEIGWLSQEFNTREGAVRAYILKHPEEIESNLTIENLVAINVWLNKWKEEDENEFERTREADLLFEKNGIYYLVETKRWKKYAQGLRQLDDLVDCFKSDFKKNRKNYKCLIRVLVTTTNRVERIEKEWG